MTNYADDFEEYDDSYEIEDEIETTPKKSWFKTFIQFVISIIIIIAAIITLRVYIIEPFVIPSSSMESTLQINDHVLSEKVTYWNESPKPGDIVTFNSTIEPGQILIKRIIATEGQTVDIQDDKVIVNGQEIQEPYTHNLPTEQFSDEYEITEIDYPYTVPKGYVWVMGDNRINSSDSRAFGAIPVENITGKAFMIYFPFERIQYL